MFWVHYAQWIGFFFLRPIQLVIIRDHHFWPWHKSLSSGPCQVLVAPFVSRYFQDGRTGTSFGRCSFSFTVLWSRHILTMFIHSDRVDLLYCFVWNYRKPRNIYPLEMAMNLSLCDFHLFMLSWTLYHTDLEQMLKENCQNIHQNGKCKLIYIKVIP